MHFFCTPSRELLCFPFRLGNGRYKTKVIYENLNPKWLEQFDLSLLEDHSQELEVTVWDKDQRSKDDFMGRCSVDLSKLEHEVTHKLWVDLEEGDGKLFMLLTISGRANFEAAIPDLDTHQDEDEELEQRRIRSFALRNTLKDLNIVGHLKVSLFLSCVPCLLALKVNPEFANYLLCIHFKNFGLVDPKRV